MHLYTKALGKENMRISTKFDRERVLGPKLQKSTIPRDQKCNLVGNQTKRYVFLICFSELCWIIGI